MKRTTTITHTLCIVFGSIGKRDLRSGQLAFRARIALGSVGEIQNADGVYLTIPLADTREARRMVRKARAIDPDARATLHTRKAVEL